MKTLGTVSSAIGGVGLVLLVAIVLSGCVQGDKARLISVETTNHVDNGSVVENTISTETSINPNISPTVPVAVGPF